MRVALGFRPHSGWAVVVIVGLADGQPVLIDRQRVELLESTRGAARQPYHAAKGLTASAGEVLVREAVESAERMAALALEQLLDGARADEDITAAGVAGGSAFEPVSLDYVLASHSRMHAAEGALFRDVLLGACAEAGLRVVSLPERELLPQAGAVLGLTRAALDQQLSELGRSLGPPWQKDHKHATLVAWLALVQQQ